MRTATAADHDAITDVIATAFHADPVWSWAFPDDAARLDQYRRFWRPFVTGAVSQGWTHVTDGGEAAALWIPQGGHELSDEDEAAMGPLLAELLGEEQGDRVERLFGEFERSRPQEPHYYLSLLGTHTDHRGHGHGMGLLADGLALIDAEGMPAYLESTNPGNDARYARHGFEPLGLMRSPDGGPVATTMWRKPR